MLTVYASRVTKNVMQLYTRHTYIRTEINVKLANNYNNNKTGTTSKQHDFNSFRSANG